MNKTLRGPDRLRRAISAVVMCVLLGVLAMQATPAMAQGLRGSATVVQTELAWSTTQLRPGGQAVLAAVLRMTPPYHINPDKPQIPGEFQSFLIPLSVEVGEVPAGVTVGQPQYPQAVPVSYGGGGKTIPGYEGQVVVYLPVSLDASYAGDAVTLDVLLTYQSCNETTCLPPATTTLSATLPVVTGATSADAPDAATAALFQDFDPASFAGVASQSQPASGVEFNVLDWRWSFDSSSVLGVVMILLMAMVGGLLLNFTPCVLPVIPIKILSLKQVAGGRGRQVRLGIAMSLGVIAFWVGLGLVMVISAGLAKQAFEAATAAGQEGAAAASGWALTSTNQLFQMPWFTIGVGVVIIVMAVGMCGLFAMRLPQWVYRINPSHDSYHGSFGFGVMTAILSTPCTAPLMGTAAAWAVTQPPAIPLTVFLAIGFGMALPYLILSANPAWIDRLPRTGPASELIKQVMGLLMLAAGVFFLGTGLSGLLVSPPQPPSRAYWWFVGLAVAAAGLWLAWRTLRITRTAVPKLIFVPAGLVLVVIATIGAWSFTDEGPIKWTYYTPDQLAAAQERGQVVVLEFTAEWCLNCKALEQGVLAQPRVASLLNSHEVAAIKVDLTGDNTSGNALLKRMDRVAIPLLVVMTPDGQEVFKSDHYSAQQVIDAVEQARTPALSRR